VIGDMKPIKETAILLLVANPVDVLTYFAHSYSGLPATQVIGSGTFLDSARLRGKLSGEVGVAASSIDAWVLGEHGESQIVSFAPRDFMFPRCDAVVYTYTTAADGF
jgi:L-lactate dehydrogenase